MNAVVKRPKRYQTNDQNILHRSYRFFITGNRKHIGKKKRFEMNGYIYNTERKKAYKYSKTLPNLKHASKMVTGLSPIWRRTYHCNI